ncbi:MAG: four helix bundle protein [Clostridia bacterium]|nr:four helix bundle protein [Clostridia bacterium]
MDNIIENKSFDFSIRIVNLCKHLNEEKKEYVLSKQILRSGTSIGANVAEAQHAQSDADFAAKMNIALKEASETRYWIRLLSATGYIPVNAANSLHADCVEIERLLSAIVTTTKNRLQ